MMERFYARSASDKADNWPFWFVADRQMGGLNRTAEVMDQLFPGVRRPGATLCCKETATALAAKANGALK